MISRVRMVSYKGNLCLEIIYVKFKEHIIGNGDVLGYIATDRRLERREKEEYKHLRNLVAAIPSVHDNHLLPTGNKLGRIEVLAAMIKRALERVLPREMRNPSFT